MAGFLGRGEGVARKGKAEMSTQPSPSQVAIGNELKELAREAVKKLYGRALERFTEHVERLRGEDHA